MSDLKPFYISNTFPEISIDFMMNEMPWIRETETRQECFFAPEVMKYTYGSGRGERTYTSVEYHPEILRIQNELNSGIKPVDEDGWNPARVLGITSGKMSNYNVCFLNRYDDASQHLGWHADDSPGMDHDHPIAVVSFGQDRELWVRPAKAKGVVPPENRYMLAGNGSLLIMPPGFQRTWEHRIPKGDKAMGPRCSLTFRHYIQPTK